MVDLLTLGGGERTLAVQFAHFLPLGWVALPIAILPVLALARGRWAERHTGPLGNSDWLAAFFSGLLRSFAWLSLVLAISGPRLVTRVHEDKIGIAALVDVSQSIAPDERLWMKEWLRNLVRELRPDDDLSVLAFGRNVQLVSEPGPPKVPDLSDDNLDGIDQTATNLMGAIEHGVSAVGSHGRALVLLTDGNQNIGDAMIAAATAKRRGLKLYTVAPPRRPDRLSIAHVSASRTSREGQDITLSVAVENRSSEVIESMLVARSNGLELGRIPIRVAPGRSILDATIPPGVRGRYRIDVHLEGGALDNRTSSTQSTVLNVLGQERILLVSRSGALAAMLRSAGFDVEIRPRLDLRAEVELRDLHAVVLADVARSDLAPESLAWLERWIREQGGGLLLAAGRTLLTDAATKGSPLERVLPVKIQEQPKKPKPTPKPEREPLALFLVIDRSSSMLYGMNQREREPSRMAYARGAALALIGQLEDRDLVGAVAFDTEPSLLSSLQPLSVSRTELNDMISRIVPNGGTDFKEALEIAGRQLIASGRRVKHILLLSDGASLRQASEHDALIAGLQQNGISVTSIRIGDDEDSYELVKQIAAVTGGSFHLVDNGAKLPELMIRDLQARTNKDRRPQPTPAAKRVVAAESTDSPADSSTPAPSGMGVEFRPTIARNNLALTGISSAELPTLRDFAPAPLRHGADAILVTDHTGTRQPVLAAWQLGLGRVAVFTADPSPEWQSWGKARQFWAQVLRWNGAALARSESLALRGDSASGLVDRPVGSRIDTGRTALEEPGSEIDQLLLASLGEVSQSGEMSAAPWLKRPPSERSVSENVTTAAILAAGALSLAAVFLGRIRGVGRPSHRFAEPL